MRALLLFCLIFPASVTARISRAIHRAQESVRALRSSPQLLQEMFPNAFSTATLSEVLEKIQSGIYALDEIYDFSEDELTPRAQISIHQLLGIYHELTPQALSLMDQVDAEEVRDRLKKLTQQLCNELKPKNETTRAAPQLGRVISGSNGMRQLLQKDGYRKAKRWKRFTRSFTKAGGRGLLRVGLLLSVGAIVAIAAYDRFCEEFGDITIRPITSLDGHLMRITRSRKHPPEYLGAALIALDKQLREVVSYCSPHPYSHRVYTTTQQALEAGEPLTRVYDYNAAALQCSRPPRVTTSYEIEELPVDHRRERSVIAVEKKKSYRYLETVCDINPELARQEPFNDLLAVATYSLPHMNDLVARASNAMTPHDIWVLFGESGVDELPPEKDQDLLWGGKRYTTLLSKAETQIFLVAQANADAVNTYLSDHRARASEYAGSDFASHYQTLQGIHLEATAQLQAIPVSIQEHERRLRKLVSLNKSLIAWPKYCERASHAIPVTDAVSISASSETLQVNPLCATSSPPKPAPVTALPPPVPATSEPNPLWAH